jgi:hypothetical protein
MSKRAKNTRKFFVHLINLKVKTKKNNSKNTNMKRFFSLVIILCSSYYCIAQTGYVNLGVSTYIKQSGGGVGGSFGIGGVVNKQITIGPAFDFVKFKGSTKIYVPAYLNFRFYLPIEKTRIYLNVSPGYGLYKYQTQSSVTKGGFYFSGGAGIHGTGKVSPYLQIGLRSVQFNSEIGSKKEKASTTFIGLDFGIKF